MLRQQLGLLQNCLYIFFLFVGRVAVFTQHTLNDNLQTCFYVLLDSPVNISVGTYTFYKLAGNIPQGFIAKYLYGAVVHFICSAEKYLKSLRLHENETF